MLLKAVGRQWRPDETAFWFFALASVWLAPFAGQGFAGGVRWSFLALALPGAALYTLAFRCYVAALAAGEVSRVAPLGSANALFVVLLGAAVHGEPLRAVNLAGTALIVYGALALEGGRPSGLWRRREARQMLAYALLLAVARMFDRAAAVQVPPGLYAEANFLAITFFLGACLAFQRRLGPSLGALRGRPGPVVAASLCNAFSYLLLIAALGSLPVSIAEPLTALSLLVTAALARLIWREPLRARLVPTLAVIAGSSLLASPAGGPPADLAPDAS